jgi:putative NADH-flavin reductase
MRVVIFGSTGATGLQILDQALAAGYEVTAFARHPAAIARSDTRLRLFAGDVSNPLQVEEAVTGQDVVLSALGAKGKIRICAPGMANILAAMKKTQVRRLVAMSSVGASESYDGSLYARVLWFAMKERMRDKNEMEMLIRSSEVDWTIVRAPALTNGKVTGHYRLGTNIPVHLWSNISRADVAHFMLKEAAAPGFLRQAPTIVSSK